MIGFGPGKIGAAAQRSRALCLFLDTAASIRFIMAPIEAELNPETRRVPRPVSALLQCPSKNESRRYVNYFPALFLHRYSATYSTLYLTACPEPCRQSSGTRKD